MKQPPQSNPLDGLDRNRLYLQPDHLPRNKPKMGLNFGRVYEMMPESVIGNEQSSKGDTYEDGGCIKTSGNIRRGKH
jgi:hypothetical protein